MIRKILYGGIAGFILLGVAATLSLSGCASTATGQAREEVIAASNAVDASAVAADAAIKAGKLPAGSLRNDIKLALDAASAALDQANTQLQAGSSGGVGFYIQQVSTALLRVSQDLIAAGVTPPTPAPAPTPSAS